MSDNCIAFMEMALEIGFNRLGMTSPNPSVGAVIVKNDKVISTGGTSSYGKDHAEVVAIKNANADISESEMYVSLEPCCHFCKTPPCTDAIITAGISKVYIPVLDPNPAVAGKGIEKLRESGIEVIIMSEMSDRAYDLIRQFRKFIIKKTPYVIHKSAITLDGRIASVTGDSKWISSEYSRYISHKLRSIVDAIIVGKNTMMRDDPALNIRLDSFSDDVKEFFQTSKLTISGRESFFLEALLKSQEMKSNSPLRALIGLPGKIDFTKKIFNDDNYIIFVNETRRDDLLGKGSDNIIKLIESGNIIFIKGNSRTEQTISILKELYQLGKMMVMLEGGGNIAGSFFDAGEIDQFFYYITPRIIGNGTEVVEGGGRKTIAESHKLHDITTVMLKEDLLYNAYSEPRLGICEEKECLQD